MGSVEEILRRRRARERLAARQQPRICRCTTLSWIDRIVRWIAGVCPRCKGVPL